MGNKTAIYPVNIQETILLGYKKDKSKKVEAEVKEDIIPMEVPLTSEQELPVTQIIPTPPMSIDKEEQYYAQQEEQPKEEPPVALERTKRKIAPKADYETLFLKMEELKDRKSVYISKGMHEKITHIAATLKNRELSVGVYIENIIEHHLEIYKDEINALYAIKTPKPL